jgi:hypothetical protein
LTKPDRIDKLSFDMKGMVIPAFVGLLLGFLSLIGLGLSNERGMM